MTGVLGMVDILGHTPLSPEQQESLGTIRYSAATLLRIIDDILNFSKIEAGRLDLEHLSLSTVELIEGVAESAARRRTAAKGLKLAAYVAADVPERVMGDPLRLRQILFNLLGNALKFTEKGSVRLSLERAGDESQLCIKVADTGVGLTEEQRERLFQPFVQADSTTTRRFGGSGLGLSIVRRLAEAMGGSVAVDSVIGIGSTFTVTVPLDPAAESVPAVCPLDGLSLVLSLPDADEARAIARYLEDAGARVVAETTGAFVGIRLLGSERRRHGCRCSTPRAAKRAWRGRGGAMRWSAPWRAPSARASRKSPSSRRRPGRSWAGACWWSTTTRSTAASSPASSSWPAPPRPTPRRAARRRSS